MANNMEIWNKVCETDPNHAKKVNSRGGFTAIDQMYDLSRQRHRGNQGHPVARQQGQHH